MVVKNKKSSIEKENKKRPRQPDRKAQPKFIQDKIKEQYPDGSHPPFMFSKRQLEIIEEKAEAGMNQKLISDYFLMNDRVFRKVLERQPEGKAVYQRGRAKLAERIISAIVERGLSGSDTCLLFYAKTQLKWNERPEEDDETVEHKPILLEFVNRKNEK